jgi:hypothetical protein
MKQIDKESYLKVVDTIVDKYSRTKNSAEVMAIAKEMKSAWAQISSVTKPAKRITKKVVKRTTKATS